jgi:hypothetical protein
MPGARRRNIGGRLALCGLTLALSLDAAAADGVDPAAYHQFWLWGPVKTGAFLDSADTLYLLQGQIGPGRAGPDLAHEGVAPFARASGGIFLVYRLETLDWDSRVVAGLMNEIRAWEHAGSRVLGIQLDFDARTPRLGAYAAFLAQVRRDLPPAYRLSVTGLLDWSTGGAPAAFDRMAGTVDEIVFQTYRGRRTIPLFRDYLAAVARLHVPFKIGLVAGGAWDPGEEQRLAASPYYRGAVVFLTERRGDRH